MLLVKSFEVPIYSLDIIVCVADKFEDAIRKFKLIDLDPVTVEDSMAFTFASDHIGKLEIYLIFANTKESLTFDTIIHELTHVTSYLCQYRGIKFDENNDEAIAYFNGYVGGKVMDIMQGFKQKLASSVTH